MLNINESAMLIFLVLVTGTIAIVMKETIRRCKKDPHTGKCFYVPDAASPNSKTAPENHTIREDRKSISLPVQMRTSDAIHNFTTRNISLSGAFIQCPLPCSIHQILDLILVLSTGNPIPVKAQVIWSNSHYPENKVVHRGIGVRFMDLSQSDRQRLRMLMEKM